MVRSGLFFVFSAPSGTGKTSIAKALLDRDKGLCASISATTRSPRGGEVHGKHYYFLDDKTFSAALEARDFVEHAEVFQHRYGTLKDPLEKASAEGRDVLLALDWQGARAMRQCYGDKTVLIYILPPQLSDLKKRLIQRGQDSPEVIAERLSCAQREIAQCVHYDYLIVNDYFPRAADQAWSILESERCRFKHQPSTLLRRFSKAPLA